MWPPYLKKWVFSLPPFRNLYRRTFEMEAEYRNIQDQVLVLRRYLAEQAVRTEEPALREMLALLKPMQVVGKNKVRVGCVGDGGYVMLEDWTKSISAQSLGIAGNVAWDLEVAAKNIPVQQYDFSIDRTPVANPLFTFHQTKVHGTEDLVLDRRTAQLLKIDIEGYEWTFFDRASTEDLALFDQIVGEFHDFDRFFDPVYQGPLLRTLRKLNQTHQLIHVHANNYWPTFQTGSMALPFLLELSYVRRGTYEFVDTRESLPGPLDSPNLAGKDDYDLNGLR